MTEKHLCRISGEEFEVTDDDQAFYAKMGVPIPTISPTMRFKWRAMWRNETTLYSGQKCALCEKKIVTMYNPKSPYTIYCYDCYWSEKWDSRDYAMDFDTSRSFIDQMKEFLEKVPKMNLGISSGDGQNINSEYVNMASACKNCYLVFNTSPAEELLYSRGIRGGRDSSDMYFGTDFENCYEGINVQESSNVCYGKNAIGCVDSHFIINGSGLMNCFGCVNLQKKSYHFMNEPMDPEEYKQKTSEILASYEKTEAFKKEFEKFSLQFPRRATNNLKSFDSTGDYLFECKNVHDSFEVTSGEDCRYIFSSKNIKDSIGTTGYGTQCEQVLEVVATGHSSKVIGSFWAENSQNILYGFQVSNCTNCSGCDGLRNGEYCIFNKQYSKEEYEKIKEHIIAELQEKDLYGLMMPPELAPFAYNETIAQTNMPLSREEAEKQGFRWEEDLQMTVGKETIQPQDIPDHIKDVPDAITGEVLKCIECQRNYKITQQEFQFYKKVSLPIPRKCFYCRYQDRITRRGPYQFWNRTCAKTGEPIVTNYAPDRPEIVYSEEAWRNEVL